MTTVQQTEDRLLEALRTIRTHWALMCLPPSGASSGAPSSDVVNGLDRRVSLAHEVTRALNGWAKTVVEDRGTKYYVPLGTDTLGLVGFLERHAQWLSWHAGGEKAANQLAKWAGKVQSTAVPSVREWLSIGACPLVTTPATEDTPAVVCGGDVRAYHGKDPTCQACGVEAVWTWWEKRINPDATDLVTAEELVGLLYRAYGSPVKPSTIRQWVVRGQLEARACTLGSRRALYDRQDAITVAARRHDAT
ncbi:MAG: hypothetical protein M3003_10515 [Candidatus Dormibacteraeota bacterium]|nr:hypothetical protein [Candidatus Dormibacteraeota bacterium]